MGRRHRTAGLNTTRQSANVAAFDSRQSPRSASQSTNRTEIQAWAYSREPRPKTEDRGLKTRPDLAKSESTTPAHFIIFMSPVVVRFKRQTRQPASRRWRMDRKSLEPDFGDHGTTSTENSLPARPAKRQK